MSVNAKNYTKQGGELTVIGGTLRIEGKLEYAEDADVPSAASAAENQNASSATTIAGLKDNFNQLLVKLKEAGLMQPDAWNTTVRLAPSLTDEVAAANNGKAQVAFSDGTITITADVSDLEESESSAPGQGTHKWIGLGIGTGLSSVTLARYNGTQLTAADAEEAVSVGLDQAGEFVLYVRAEELVHTPKVITLDADGYATATINITVVDTEGE